MGGADALRGQRDVAQVTGVAVAPAICAGFLLAVLWMDLIFDTQVLAYRRAGSELPEPVLASIAGYYHRATMRPMSALIAAVMAVLVIAVAIRVVSGHAPWWLIAAAGLLAGGPIMLALTRTVPHAVRLGRREDTVAVQSRLARSILVDHLACFGLMVAFLSVWVTAISLGC